MEISYCLETVIRGALSLCRPTIERCRGMVQLYFVLTVRLRYFVSFENFFLATVRSFSRAQLLLGDLLYHLLLTGEWL
ncbi:MAG: hypothetical protein LBV77_01800 [Candidatus Adiutrix intracellularis]|nr:hypothetical protein [Candidatus Adiutrix intracellularis]